MIANRTDGQETRLSEGTSPWIQWGVLGAVCMLVIGVYSYAAHSGVLESPNPNPGDSYYNLLVQGFRAGQLSLKKEVPPGLAKLPDPYDPAANAPYRSEPYRMVDMSYYKGRFYLYFGVTPAVVLFWPFTALTGHYLFHRHAVVIFCGLGFLASVGLLRALWRRYFAEVSVGVVAACAVALGLATGVPVLLSRSEVYEVPISCGYMLVMLALGAIWRALHEPPRHRMSGSGWSTTPGAWLALASVTYGLAVGARPNLLFGAVILLAPVAQAWRRQRPMGALLTAAAGPIALIGLGLMLYNTLRFDHPFEFGGRYQLGPGRQDTVQYFSLRYLWFNFRVYFLEPARWGGRFPFVREAVLPALPPGHHGNLQDAFAVLTNIPLVWLALAAPLACRGRSAEDRSVLQGFLAAMSLLMGICTLTIGTFFCVAMRYEMEFLPALVLLAVIGIIGLERALDSQPGWQRAARGGWGLLLGFSVMFNLLAGIENYAEADNNQGFLLANAGRFQEAIKQYEWALRLKPDSAEPHFNLGIALEQVGKPSEAIGHYEQAVRLKPDFVEAHNNLGIALARSGEVQRAIEHYELALRIKPGFFGVHCNLGNALLRVGKIQEAIGHYEQAVRLKPDYAEAHYNWAVALEQTGRRADAIEHYEQALRIQPDLTEAQKRLARLRATQ